MFTIVSDNQNILNACNRFTYQASYDGSPISEDATLPTVVYDEENRQFSVFSDDLGTFGLKTITVDSFLED